MPNLTVDAHQIKSIAPAITSISNGGSGGGEFSLRQPNNKHTNEQQQRPSLFNGSQPGRTAIARLKSNNLGGVIIKIWQL